MMELLAHQNNIIRTFFNRIARLIFKVVRAWLYKRYLSYAGCCLKENHAGSRRSSVNKSRRGLASELATRKIEAIIDTAGRGMSEKLGWRSFRFALLTFSVAAATLLPLAPTRSETQVPDRLLYIFDLPWCSSWRFSCVSCEKGDQGIRCETTKDDCSENFGRVSCEKYKVPGQCRAWFDGCNHCSAGTSRHGHIQIGCTQLGCTNYRPRFICLREQPEQR